MFALKTRKKLAGAIALFAVSGLLAGCDDHHHHPHPRPPHEGHRGDRPRDGRHGHRPPPRDGHHRPRHGNGDHRHDRRRHAALVGDYSAIALNDAVMPKGTEISLNVVQGADESLHLVDPTGNQYPIEFDADTGTGYIAGGSLSLRDDGQFVYKDAHGGIWLVVRQ